MVADGGQAEAERKAKRQANLRPAKGTERTAVATYEIWDRRAGDAQPLLRTAMKSTVFATNGSGNTRQMRSLTGKSPIGGGGPSGSTNSGTGGGPPAGAAAVAAFALRK